MKNNSNIFPSGAIVSRVFPITGIIGKVTRPSRNTYAILVKPDRHSCSGIWLNGFVPYDRIPGLSVFAELKVGQKYTFDVAASGNKYKTPDAPHRVDFDIIRVYLSKSEQASCNGRFGISGVVTAIEKDFIVLQSRELKASEDRPMLPSRLMALRFRRTDRNKFFVGQHVALRVHVSPSYFIKQNTSDVAPRACPHAVIHEIVSLDKMPEAKLVPGPNQHVRKGHYRTSSNGNRHWVSACLVTRTK